MGELFRKYPAFRTTDPGQYEDWMKSFFGIPWLDLRLEDDGFESLFNHVALPNIGLTYGRYRSQIQADITLDGYFQGFSLTGAGEAQMGRNDWSFRAGASSVAGPGTRGLITYGSGYSQIIQSIPSAPLVRKLSAMIGEPVEPSLQMTGRLADPERIASQRRLVQFLADELERGDDGLPPIVMAEMEQAIIVAFLATHEHNYSHRLTGTPRDPAPWQVRRAVEYIRENWNEAIMIEDLVQATGTPARNLFHLFQKAHGLSPIAYANKMRLSNAHAMLSRPNPATNVTTVCFDCGFSNPGMFAKKYFSAFGELPSETLRRSR